MPGDGAQEQLWADYPLPLVDAPAHATEKDDVFAEGAARMAVLHNVILRGFNSIYLQAPYVQPRDYRDFVGYSLTWCRLVKTHHDNEEAHLFPAVEIALGVVGALDHSREEHHAFMYGLTRFNTYLVSLLSANRTADFNGNKLVAIMDCFKDAFCHHFHHEISYIAKLRDLAATVCGDEQPAEVAAGFAAWEKTSAKSAGASDILPFILVNHERAAAGGRWRDWPPMSAPVRWVLVNFAAARNNGYWKFASCTSDGRRKPLCALGAGAAAEGRPSRASRGSSSGSSTGSARVSGDRAAREKKEEASVAAEARRHVVC